MSEEFDKIVENGKMAITLHILDIFLSRGSKKETLENLHDAIKDITQRAYSLGAQRAFEVTK